MDEGITMVRRQASPHTTLPVSDCSDAESGPSQWTFDSPYQSEKENAPRSVAYGCEPLGTSGHEKCSAQMPSRQMDLYPAPFPALDLMDEGITTVRRQASRPQEPNNSFGGELCRVEEEDTQMTKLRTHVRRAQELSNSFVGELRSLQDEMADLTLELLELKQQTKLCES